MARTYAQAKNFIQQLPLCEFQTPDHGFPVDDNNTVYSKDCFVIFVQDPPGSGNYVKKRWCWEDFNVQNHTTGTQTADDITVEDLIYTGTLTAPEVTTLTSDISDLDARIAAVEATTVPPILTGYFGIFDSNVTPTSGTVGTWEVLDIGSQNFTGTFIDFSLANQEFTCNIGGDYTGALIMNYTLSPGATVAICIVKNGGDPNAGAQKFGLKSDEVNGFDARSLRSYFVFNFLKGETFKAYYLATGTASITYTASYDFGPSSRGIYTYTGGTETFPAI